MSSGFILFLSLTFTLAWHDLQQGVFTAADFIFVVTFALGFNWRMNIFVDILRHVAKKSEDLEKYLEILDLKPAIKDPENPQEIQNFHGKISFENVSFKYEKRKKLDLNKLNLVINPGEVVALVGFSGAGKTTVVKILQRMFYATSGTIYIYGVKIK